MNGHRRTFTELRQAILIALLSGQQTTNEISIKTGINWRTAEAHLTFLASKGFVSEILRMEYVRIFRLTPIGEEHARFLLQTHRTDSSSQPPQQPQRKERAEKARKEEVMQP